jgi:hypothetical protein
MIELPDRMKHLDRDHRGYPIPYIVFRDSDGKPHFTINDEYKVQRCKKHELCSICGARLLRGRWFVGGPMSALAPTGAYVDPPLHYECMQFALQTCPYLLSAKYQGRLDGATLDPKKAPGVIGLLDTTMIPERPKIFIGVMAVGQFYTDRGYIVPKKPFRAMEFWRDGRLEKRFERDVIAAAMQQAAIAFQKAGML